MVMAVWMFHLKLSKPRVHILCSRNVTENCSITPAMLNIEFVHIFHQLSALVRL